MSISTTVFENAALDLAHIAEVATSAAETATDRMGNIKRTLAGLEAEFPDASLHAAAAAASAGEAASARDAAIVQSGVYVDEPTGRAAVLDGQAFKVQGSGDVAAYEYRRTSAAESVLIASYPSGSAVTALRQLLKSNEGSNALLVWADSGDNVVAYMTPEMELMLPTVDGFKAVQGTMLAAGEDAGDGALAVFADKNGKVYATFGIDGGLSLAGMSGTVQQLAEVVETSGASGLPANIARFNANIARAYIESERGRVEGIASIYHNSIVAAQGADGTETQRIPGLLVLSPTTALLAWQQRLAGYGYSGDAQYQRLVCRTITYTPGVGISSSETRVIDAPADVTKNSNHPHIFLSESGVVTLLYNNNETGAYRVYRRTSTDGGATWSARTEVATALPGGAYIALGSNGTVERVPEGYANAGRWMVPIYGVDYSGSYCGVLVSDDDGVTWSSGPLLHNGLNIQEAAITLTHEGDLLMAMRRADSPYLVHFARLPLDPGTTWEDMGLNDKMTTATCDMSMCQVAPEIGDGVPAVAHCGPSIVARRANRIRISYDAGRVWHWAWKRPDVSDAPGNGAGYTSIKMLQKDLFIVAYETAESATTDSSIGVYIVNLSEVFKNGYRL